MVMMDSVSLNLLTLWVRFNMYNYYISCVVPVCFIKYSMYSNMTLR